VIVSASPVPGNESSWRALLNRFAQRTNRIYLSPAFAVHASGHASREELAVVFRRLDCRCLVPVHADPWLRSLSLAVAEENGIPGDRVIFPVEGDRLVLQDKRVRLPIRKAPVFEPAGDGSRQERKRLAEEGVAFLCVSRKSDRIGSISITVRGFFRAEEHAGLLNDISDRLSGVLEDRIRSGPAPNRELRQVLQQEGQRLFRERCGRHPWVLAQIIDSADLT
jgi:ribonuclease J